MKAVRKLLFRPFALAALVLPVLAAAPQYQVLSHLALGGKGGWDYLSVDAATHLLYLSRADHVAVVDTATGKDIGDIADTPGVHGIALAPELNRGFISAGKADAVKVFDLKTRAVLGSLPTGAGPDAIVYEPVTQRVFAFNGHGHSITAIDAKTLAPLATIALNGKPEEARPDGRGLVVFNIEDTGELATLDAKALSLKSRWPLPQCESPSGLAVDAAHRRSFSACDNQTLVVFDIDAGKRVASLPIGKGVDGAEFDPASQDIYSSNGEGTLTVIHENGPDDYAVTQTLPTQHGARTIALDAVTHRLYLPTAELGPAPPATADNPRPRPAIMDGTFSVLVVGR
jgi:DNA-binding beta-propeller fold protein YncE